MKSYGQYCPMAHALDLVGERWSLLVVRELLEERQLRYTDLQRRLTGCGTNILAARLKQLEQGGVVRRRQLPPPAASTVYELTEFGEGLRSVLHELAHWGARSLGPPVTPGLLEQGWLPGALRIALPPTAPCIEFRIGEEVAYVADGEAYAGHAEGPAAVVEGDVASLFSLLVDRDLDAVAITGDESTVRELLASLPKQTPPLPAPTAAAA
jgi:DNA-binding HxlR family transcriptional regulator